MTALKTNLIPLSSNPINWSHVLQKIYNFRTHEAININYNVLMYGTMNIKRTNSIKLLSEYIRIDHAITIEEGIFEYSAIKISTVDSSSYEFIVNTYNGIVNEIVKNLNPSCIRVNNTTLKNSIESGLIDPYYLAFMSPQQLHPLRWKTELDKIKNTENANSIENKKLTDIYTCGKCKNKKFTTTQMQTRSADEPATIFATCLVCYNTFTTQ
jgi:DNA-directed RNA polymerase subunit M/transcription elongation factor TFIIS